MTVRGRRVNAQWTSAIVGWVGKAQQRRAVVSTSDISTRGKYGKRTTQTIDLEADGVPDFHVYAGVEPPSVEVETLWKMLFVNVDGKWLPIGFAQESDCT